MFVRAAAVPQDHDMREGPSFILNPLVEAIVLKNLWYLGSRVDETYKGSKGMRPRRFFRLKWHP